MKFLKRIFGEGRSYQAEKEREEKPYQFKIYEKIYVQLEDWTGCVPTQGKHISDDIFELQESEEFPSDDDVWVFKPGDLVRGVVVTKKNAHKYHLAKDGFERRKSILFAYEKVEG